MQGTIGRDLLRNPGDPMNAPTTPALNSSRENVAPTSSGYVIFVVFLVMLLLTVLAMAAQVNAAPVILVLGCLILFLIAKGFYMLQPNQAAAIMMFGSYKGTDRATGLRWEDSRPRAAEGCRSPR